jgi:hypothetical protein
MSPSKRIASLIARRARLEDAAARAQIQLLTRLRRELLAELANAQGFRLFRVQTMLGVIDHEIGRLAPEVTNATAAPLRQAWELGLDLVIGVEGGTGLYSVSPTLLQSVLAVTSQDATSIWLELGNRLKSIVGRVALGAQDPFDAMAKLARAIKDPKTFGTAFTRAETLIRTETNRVFALATQARAKESDERLRATGDRLVKYWLSAEDARVREAHAEAATTYSKDRPIPIDRPFIVGGEKLMHPLDPSASAANTVNCRCVEVVLVVTAEQFDALLRAA